MSKTKFTKGPWKVQDDGYGLIGVAFRKGYGVLVGHKDNESISNSHLIAAAPEMYEMLEHILLEPYGREDLSNERIEKLLAKARGEQNA